MGIFDKGVGMELLIGGRAQGKLDVALVKYPEAFVFDEEIIQDKRINEFLNEKDLQDQVLVWNHFHLYVKKSLALGYGPEKIWEEVFSILQSFPKLIIISDEIGNGIVPMDRDERRYREETGRILCKLAKEATEVERIFCGIPQTIYFKKT